MCTLILWTLINLLKFFKYIEFRDEFIPWDKQDPTLHEGDIKLVGDKNAILSNSYRWANAQIPYVISADYS